jgi:beta-phosphoglucomutase-like phosphatase (HAD superfamily)
MPIFRGAIFDVDGVLVDSPHEKAWRESLRELMESDWQDIREQTTWSPDAFTPRVYEQYVSGKPRMSGARAALDYFDVPDAEKRVAEYAQRKQEMVLRLIDAGDFTAYPDALRFVITTKEAGLRIADASSSKNATSFLSKIRLDTFAQENKISAPTVKPGTSLLDYFDVDLSGRDFAHGKPDPEIFLTAAYELGVEPREAIVMEDAAAGVEAAKRGGMNAIGIARADDAELLAAADLVVTTLDEVDTAALTQRTASAEILTRQDQRLNAGGRGPLRRPARRACPDRLPKPSDRRVVDQVIKIDRPSAIFGIPVAKVTVTPIAFAVDLVVGSGPTKMGAMGQITPVEVLESVPLLHEVVPAVITDLLDSRMGRADVRICGAYNTT